MFFYLFAFTSNSLALDIHIDKYEKKKHWNKPPTVVVCDDAPVSLNDVKKAVSAWSYKGVKFSDVRKQHSNECQKKWSWNEEGDILITNDARFLDKSSYNGWTVTYTYPEDRSLITSAICEINPDKIKSDPGYSHKLLVHEIGHAIGYDHSHFSKNDVMKPSLSDVN